MIRDTLTKEQLATPAMQYFRENVPNISLVKNDKTGFLEMVWKDKEGGGVDMQAFGGNPLSATSGFE